MHLHNLHTGSSSSIVDAAWFFHKTVDLGVNLEAQQISQRLAFSRPEEQSKPGPGSAQKQGRSSLITGRSS